MKLSIKTLGKLIGKKALLNQVIKWLLKLLALFYSELSNAVRFAITEVENHPDLSGKAKLAFVWDYVREQFDDADDYKWLVNFMVELYVGTLTVDGKPRYKRLLDKNDPGRAV